MSAKRASKAELVKRRKEIKELLIQGHDKSFIVERIAKLYNTSNRAVSEDIRQIGKEWEELSPEENAQLRSMYQERLEWLFCEAAGKGNIRDALAVQKEIHQIAGIYKDKEDKEEKIPQFIEVSRRRPLKVVPDDES